MQRAANQGSAAAFRLPVRCRASLHPPLPGDWLAGGTRGPDAGRSSPARLGRVGLVSRTRQGRPEQGRVRPAAEEERRRAGAPDAVLPPSPPTPKGSVHPSASAAV